MHCACAEGHKEAIEALIALGANVNAQDHEGNTPLHVATRTRHTSIAQTLLKSGANTEIADEVTIKKNNAGCVIHFLNEYMAERFRIEDFLFENS